MNFEIPANPFFRVNRCIIDELVSILLSPAQKVQNEIIALSDGGTGWQLLHLEMPLINFLTNEKKKRTKTTTIFDY